MLTLRAAAPRLALARVVARRLCAAGVGPEPPPRRPVPRGFERFFPAPGGGGSAPAGHATRASPPKPPPPGAGAKPAAAAGESGAGASSSGGGPKKDGGRRVLSSGEMMMAAAGGLLLANAFDWPRLLGFDGAGEGAGSRREISFQQFLAQVLPSGRVRRLVVVNGASVRVYVGDYQTTDAAHAALAETRGIGGIGGGLSGGGTLDGAEHASRARDVPPLMAGRRADGSGSVGAVGAGGGESVAFVFNIGSVDQFEERLDGAQRELGYETGAYVPVRYVSVTSLSAELLRWAPTALIVGLMLFALPMATGGAMGGGAGQIFNVAKSKAKRAGKVSTRFTDVAGLTEAKAEVMEFVDFLKAPGRYTKLGARIPKGALLVGPPGCGKTLLAKAVAGEAERPFFSVSGSDFIEMFVGVGPARVRDMFAEARKAAVRARQPSLPPPRSLRPSLPSRVHMRGSGGASWRP